MAASCRFAFAIHILSVLALSPGKVLTSSALAASVNTNPVVIRRLLSTLQNAGFIVTSKGAGAGSRLACAPAEISLGELYCAIEPARGFSPHPHLPNQRCCVGRGIEQALERIFAVAQSAMEEALNGWALADVLAAIDEKTPARAPAKKRLAHKSA